MPSSTSNALARGRPSRWVFWALILLLVAFAGWCVALLLRVHDARSTLSRHLGWIENVQAIHQVLGRHQREPDADLTQVIQMMPTATWQALERHVDPNVRVSAQRLQASLEALRQPTGADQRWAATSAAASAASSTDAILQNQVLRIHGRLGGLWTAFQWLVAASLALAASNLGFLALAQRRGIALEQAHTTALSLASHDQLTGLLHREAAVDLLRRELDRSRRQKLPLGVLLFQIVGFRDLTALVGHVESDAILTEVAHRLRPLVRAYDTFGRYRTDTFLAVLPACDRSASDAVAQRIVNAVTGQPVEHAHGRVTLDLTMASETFEVINDAEADSILRRLRNRLGAGAAVSETQ